MAQRSVYVNKKFGFNTMKWVIKNYCVTSGRFSNVFTSPEFFVRGLHLTKWIMTLERLHIQQNNDNVLFYLKRLPYGSFADFVSVECVLQYSDHEGITVEEDFKCMFEENCSESFRLRYTGLTRTTKHHSNEFHLTCHILVNFENVNEDVPLCSNVGLKSLGNDLLLLYESESNADLKIQFARRPDPINVHRAVLFSRIKNEEFRKKIISTDNRIDLSDFDYVPGEKICQFLYSADINYTLISPSISVYELAEHLDIKPVMAYYEPDKISFTSTIEVEEYYASWTIEDFRNRNENVLLSPLMINNLMDVKWRLKVYPKGTNKDSKYVCVHFIIETKSTKSFCVQIFLKKEIRRTYRSYHKTVKRTEIVIVTDFVALDHVINNYDELTIDLQLRLSLNEKSVIDDEFLSFDKSVSGDYYFYHEKNYERLSEDILSIYQNEHYADINADLKDLNILLLAHECILVERCINLLHTLKIRDYTYLNSLPVAVVFELISFVYSGKIRERFYLNDIFSLYAAARHFTFESLKTVIIQKLDNILSELNAREILQFAEAEEIESLRDSAQNLI